MTGFPSVPLGIKVELLLNGAWTDVSTYVLSRDTIAITGGRTNRGDKAQPAQAALTFDNRDGRFSPSNTSGAYYPYIGRNTQIRISVTATSSTGNFYSGYRFWGEVPTWPPISDISGNDVYVQVVASGPLRRIRTGGGKGSALTRYYAALTGSFAPVAYWPCEEDPDTTIIGAGIDGGTNMSVTAGTPKWKTGSFNGSTPVGTLNNSTWDGLTGSFGSSGDDIFNTPGTYQWTASTSTVNAKVTGACGGGASGNPFAAQGGSGGGGGEFAQEATLAVTVGNTYTVVVASGGSPGAGLGSGSGSNVGSDGSGVTSIAGDSVTVTANTGKGASNVAGGAGGTGSSNTVHHNGGAGATSNAGDGGAGGGGTGGTSAAGNAGSAESGNTGGAGGVAVTGGFAGGAGGSAPTSSPVTGGGGGGGPYNAGGTYGRAGAAGAPGRVELVYTPQTSSNTNVIRFMMQTPSWGGNSSKVLLRALTSGTVGCLEVQFDSTAKKLVLKGFATVGGTLLFTGNLSSSIVSGGAGLILLVSAELSTSGANVAWRLACVQPGGTADFDSVSGTLTTASIGNVTEVIAAPNADITKTALGHISVQYAFVSLSKVSNALNGHHTEIGVDRFVRLLNEQALDNAIEFNEGADHWGFESGTQSWTAGNGALTSSTVTAVTNITNYTLFISWPPEGSHSLLLTCNGAGAPFAASPSGTSGQPVIPKDIVSLNLEVYTPAAVSNLVASIDFYNAGGSFLSSAFTVFSTTTGQQQTVSVTTGGSGAPATAAFFGVKVSNASTLSNGTLIYIDHVRVHTRMGPQTRKEYHKFLEEIEDLDQGILKEAKELHGLKYRTRFRMINQTPAVTLDYSAQTLADPPAPVIDDQKTKNDITVHRHKG